MGLKDKESKTYNLRNAALMPSGGIEVGINRYFEHYEEGRINKGGQHLQIDRSRCLGLANTELEYVAPEKSTAEEIDDLLLIKYPEWDELPEDEQEKIRVDFIEHHEHEKEVKAKNDFKKSVDDLADLKEKANNRDIDKIKSLIYKIYKRNSLEVYEDLLEDGQEIFE
jgi:hypothetical protein